VSWGDESHEHMPDADRLRSLLVGKTVLTATMSDEPPDKYDVGPTGTIALSDGTVLKVWGNDGGCACDAGCYPLSEVNVTNGIVTNVEVEERPDGDFTDDCPECGKGWGCEHRGYYRIYVVTPDERSLLASFDGSDGNGYYGTGWWLQVAS
jgi:hypothetical protein